jgi:hypothetical protein
MGLIPSGIRLPLVPFSSQYHQALASTLRELGLVKN